MTTCNQKARSRPLGVAEKLVSTPIDEASVYSRTVVLTGDQDILSTANGRWCLIDALMLAARIVGKLVVMLPTTAGDLRSEVEDIIARLWCHGTVQVLVGEQLSVMENAAVVLNIGTENPDDPRWTTINSNGWVARVSSSCEALSDEVGQSNPLGALMAASLGVTEAFKRIFDVPAETAPLLPKTEFSLYELRTAPSDCGPELPHGIRLPDTVLIGGGAIGNALALLLSQLPLQGRVHIVDKQDYAEENHGTCLLTERFGWAGKPKAERLAEWLRSNAGLYVTGEKALISDAIREGTIKTLSVDLVLNGLDDNQARRDSQKLWPSTIVDGSVSEVGASVTQYRLHERDLACLQCWFEEQPVDARIEQSQLTGLSVDSLSMMDRPLTDSDIENASPDRREWLRQCASEGKTICSVISEASLAGKLGVQVEEGFRPSVPFVASASAAMVMAEAVKALAFPETGVVGLFQIASLFLGLDTSVSIKTHPSRSCQCVVQRKTIERLWRSRERTGSD